MKQDLLIFAVAAVALVLYHRNSTASKSAMSADPGGYSGGVVGTSGGGEQARQEAPMLFKTAPPAPITSLGMEDARKMHHAVTPSPDALGMSYSSFRHPMEYRNV